MQLVIKPADDSFDMMLEAGQYERIWQEHSKTILDAFKTVTGLSFQQRHITAKVTRGTYGNAGLPGKAMILPGDHTSEDRKACTLMHELGHRLLGGNALNPIGLGLLPDTEETQKTWQWYEHRHLYLFLQDAVREAFGPVYAERCAKEESYMEPEYYNEAWNWAMGMSPAQRQRAVKLLAAEALTRSRWHERDDLDEIPPKDADAWFENLHPDHKSHNYIKHVSYGVIPIFKDNDEYKYLLLQNNGGFWGFPKGHTETGESPKATAIREAYEETGIKVDPDEIDYSVDYSYQQPIDNKMQTKKIVLFPVTVSAKKVVLQKSEIKSHEWVSYDKAVSLVNLTEFTQAMRKVELHLKPDTTKFTN